LSRVCPEGFAWTAETSSAEASQKIEVSRNALIMVAIPVFLISQDALA
jgi:hypothetical protein